MIFIAGSMKDVEKIKKIANVYEEYGHVIKRKWWNQTDENKKHEYALEDKKAIKKCDLFIMYNGTKKTGGKYVELGMALMEDKEVHVYGKKLTTIYRHLTKYISEYFDKEQPYFCDCCDYDWYEDCLGKGCLKIKYQEDEVNNE